MEGLTYEKEDLTFEMELELFSIGTITLSEETISWLNVGVSKIISTKESDPEQKTLGQTTTEMVLSIVKLEDFCVKPKVSLEDKVYPETYYHHNHDDMQVDETPVKI
jgi:hypothetical protein